jgi:hypothetical protein
MTASQREEKTYNAFVIEWNDGDEEYEYLDVLIYNGEPLEFDTYAEFLDFMNFLSREEKEYLGLWRLCHTFTGDYITIVDGLFDGVNFISMNAAKFEVKK